MIAQLAIMRDMGIAQQQVVGTDPRRHIAMRAAVDGGIFPENIVVAHLEVSRVAEILQILSLSTDHREGEKLVATPDFRMPFDHDVGMQNAVVANLNVGSDQAKRSDPDIVPESGQR